MSTEHAESGSAWFPFDVGTLKCGRFSSEMFSPERIKKSHCQADQVLRGKGMVSGERQLVSLLEVRPRRWRRRSWALRTGRC